MTTDEARAAFLEELARIAPDVDTAAVRGDDHLQDDLDLDSMDVLTLVTALHQRFGIDIPEAEYDQISTPDRAADYLSRQLS